MEVDIEDVSSDEGIEGFERTRDGLGASSERQGNAPSTLSGLTFPQIHFRKPSFSWMRRCRRWRRDTRVRCSARSSHVELTTSPSSVSPFDRLPDELIQSIAACTLPTSFSNDFSSTFRPPPRPAALPPASNALLRPLPICTLHSAAAMMLLALFRRFSRFFLHRLSRLFPLFF